MLFAGVQTLFGLVLGMLVWYLKRQVSRLDEEVKDRREASKELAKLIDEIERRFARDHKDLVSQVMRLEVKLAKEYMTRQELAQTFDSKFSVLDARLSALGAKMEARDERYDANIQKFYREYGPALDVMSDFLKRQAKDKLDRS